MLSDNPRILCACTVGNPPFAELVSLAAENGFDGLSLWRPYLEQEQAAGTSLARMRELLREHDVVVDQVEAVADWSSSAATPATAAAEQAQVLALAEALGAARILAVNMASPLPLDTLRQRFAVLCEVADQRGMGIALEFLPWSGIPDLAAALEVLADAPAGHGLMLDSWHILRAGVSPEAIAALPGERIVGVQWNDPLALPATPATFEETMTQRALPGEGVADLRSLVSALAQTGTRAPQAVEVMNLQAAPEAASWTRRAARSLQQLLTPLL